MSFPTAISVQVDPSVVPNETAPMSSVNLGLFPLAAAPPRSKPFDKSEAASRGSEQLGLHDRKTQYNSMTSNSSKLCWVSVATPDGVERHSTWRVAHASGSDKVIPIDFCHGKDPSTKTTGQVINWFPENSYDDNVISRVLSLTSESIHSSQYWEAFPQTMVRPPTLESPPEDDSYMAYRELSVIVHSATRLSNQDTFSRKVRSSIITH